MTSYPKPPPAPNTKTVTLLANTGAPLAILTCTPAEAATLGNAIEAAAGHACDWYTLPGVPARRINLAVVALYAIQ